MKRKSYGVKIILEKKSVCTNDENFEKEIINELNLFFHKQKIYGLYHVEIKKHLLKDEKMIFEGYGHKMYNVNVILKRKIKMKSGCKTYLKCKIMEELTYMSKRKEFSLAYNIKIKNN